jgi:hypothetical protein
VAEWLFADGDVIPVAIPEKVVAMVGMLIGVTVFAYIMGTVSELLSTLNAQNKRIQDRQQQLDSFIRTHKIPPQLGLKLREFYDYVLNRQVHSEDLVIVNGLSGSLRQQVRPFHVHQQDYSLLSTAHAHVGQLRVHLSNDRPRLVLALTGSARSEESVHGQPSHTSSAVTI